MLKDGHEAIDHCQVKSAVAASARSWASTESVLIVFVIGAMFFMLGWIRLPTILERAGRIWAVSDQIESADAAVVLGGGTDTRPYAAAQLYKSGCVGQILVTNSRARNAKRQNPDWDKIVSLGIPTTAITEFGNAPANTYDEARSLALWAKQNRVQRIIVPMEVFPSRRVQWILRRQLGAVGVRVMIATLAPKNYDLNNWWQTKDGLRTFRNEVIKYVYYRIRYWRS
jgi:uncharacterized SAM-binding protein YcdF (DUF218 family)